MEYINSTESFWYILFPIIVALLFFAVFIYKSRIIHIFAAGLALLFLILRTHARRILVYEMLNPEQEYIYINPLTYILFLAPVVAAGMMVLLKSLPEGKKKVQYLSGSPVFSRIRITVIVVSSVNILLLFFLMSKLAMINLVF